MSKETKQIEPTTAPEARVSLEYVGPPEQSSPDHGPLVAGRRYQMAADLAAYLSATHPDYWQAVRPPKE